MKLRYFVFALLFTFYNTSSYSMWETGELTYSTGETEVSAFVNAEGNTQLQAVLCSKNAASAYRFTLLLSKNLTTEKVLQVELSTDESKSIIYAEASGNSLDMQIDESIFAVISETTSLKLEFSEENALFLGLPQSLDINMQAADLSLKNVASQCTVRCISNGYKCNNSLLSTLLWPKDKFENVAVEDIDTLCTNVDRTHKEPYPKYHFNDTKACRLALDRFYKKEGIGALSFLNELFNGKNSAFKKYVKAWNEAVELAPFSITNQRVIADDRDWYLILYALSGNYHVTDFSGSFYAIKKLTDDPTTLVYNTESRYELELLKYLSVLYRRMDKSLQSIQTLEKSHKYWSEFYRVFSLSLPSNIQQAQALRPVIYRAMLKRIWYLAGRPDGIKILPKYAFKQGIQNKTITDDLLESQCSLFDGVNGEEFFFASNECIKGIDNHIRALGLHYTDFQKVAKSWDKFAKSWRDSPFSSEGLEDAVGEHLRARLGLAAISLFKKYGFGDYFLLRECISTQDKDICNFEYHKIYNTYSKEFNYRLDSISKVSAEDGNALVELNKLWEKYFNTLHDYVRELAQSNLIEDWKADLALGMAVLLQTNALLNFPYDREEMFDNNLEDEFLFSSSNEIEDDDKLDEDEALFFEYD